MAAPEPPQALLFDLGGVVFEIDFNLAFARWAAHAGCEPALLKQRFAFDDAYARHEKGLIDAADYFASLRTSLGIDISDEQFADGWNAIYLGEIDGIDEELERAASKLPVYAFTNSNKLHETY